MPEPIEVSVFEFLDAAVNDAAVESPLEGIAVHDTVYRPIEKNQPNGVRISDCVSTIAPEPGGGMKEYDAELVLACFAKIEGADKKQRQDALKKVFEIQTAVIELLYSDGSLGGRVCDVLIRRSPRSFDVFEGNPYAVAMIPLVVNPSGSEYEE